MGKIEKGARGRGEVERVLIALGAWGETAAYDHRGTLARWYREDWPAWLEARAAMRSAGLAEDEIMDLVCDEHPPECACWGCVLALHVEVVTSLFPFYRN